MLQRSVTEIRRLPSGRPNVSRRTGSDMRRKVGRADWGTAGRLHPRLAPIGPQFLLPHAHAPLPLSDHVAPRLDRVRPVRRRSDDRDARLAHWDQPQPVPHRNPGSRPALPDLRDDTTQLSLDHLLVGGVLDRGHAVLIRAVAHVPEKHARAAALGRRDGGKQLVDNDGGAGEVAHGSVTRLQSAAASLLPPHLPRRHPAWPDASWPPPPGAPRWRG